MLGELAATLLVKASETIGEHAGAAGTGALARFAGWLRERVSGHLEASTALALVEEVPDSPSRVQVLAQALDRYAQEEQAFALELREQVEQARSGLDVTSIAQTAVGDQIVQVSQNQGNVGVSYGPGQSASGSS